MIGTGSDPSLQPFGRQPASERALKNRVPTLRPAFHTKPRITEQCASGFFYWLALTDAYRHAHAIGLMPKRRRDVREALERIIERNGEVDVRAAAEVAAVKAYARMNSADARIDKMETISLNRLFDRMSADELETYAQTEHCRRGLRPKLGQVNSYCEPRFQHFAYQFMLCTVSLCK